MNRTRKYIAYQKMEFVVQKAKVHCTKILLNSRCRELPFHNLKHTLDVFNNVKKIGQEEGITRIMSDVLSLAALFHDTGNADRFENHEELSISYAESFMRKERIEPHYVQQVKGCIMATKIPQRPMNIMEQIICDADLNHLGNRNFYIMNERLRREWEQYKSEYHTDYEWYSMNIDFLQDHKFHTYYGKTVLEPFKLENLMLFELFLTNMNVL